jgi:N-acetylmuramoyl-L-alanine amidase
MKGTDSAKMQRDTKRVFSVIGIAALSLCLALPAHADKKSQAREQFARAVKMRTMLEGYLEKDRSLSDYKQTIAAYHKVYLITPQAPEVTPSLVAEAELYREMGRLFDSKYFQSSVHVYMFLLKQYPGSRYRGAALLAIAEAQEDDLNKPEDAEATYKEYLKRFPRSEGAPGARAALKEIAENQATDNEQQPDVNGQRVEPRTAGQHTSSVTGVRTWNAQDSTRIVVSLDDTIKYDAAHIFSPNRIYFDLYKARISPELSGRKLDVPGGLLKTVRIAQNKQGVVRLVLDVDGARDYSAFLLANPYRLVIDVHAPRATTMAVAAKPDTEEPAAHSALAVSEAVSVSAERNPSSGKSASNSNSKITAHELPSPSNTHLKTAVSLKPPSVAKPTRDGQRSLARTLGLKISRIVIDPGHGGHDTGTIGPHGLMEKDLCLDVALRLGRLIQQKLPGAEVIYTRKDDTFVPLEERTAIANKAKADLFISIHANSSRDPKARGIETYYLNFATSPESMEVAARENANSQESLHDLQDLIKRIARNDKIEESKELAGDIQETLAQRLQLVSRRERNRGVKKAPFVVLIGANMPSVLSEISFVSNPKDERLLRKPDQRQRIADGLYRGITTYLDNLNSLTYDKQKLISDNHVPDDHLEAAAVTSTGNPK